MRECPELVTATSKRDIESMNAIQKLHEKLQRGVKQRYFLDEVDAKNL